MEAAADALRPSGYEHNFLIIAPLHRKNMSQCKELCALRSGYNYRQQDAVRIALTIFIRASRVVILELNDDVRHFARDQASQPHGGCIADHLKYRISNICRRLQRTAIAEKQSRLTANLPGR